MPPPMPPPPPHVLRLGASVLLSGPAVLQAWAFLDRGVKLTSARDGITVPALVREIEAALRAATAEGRVSPSRHGDVANGATLPGSVLSEELGTREVARMAGLSARQVQRLRDLFGGRLVGGRLIFTRARVEAAIAERKAGHGHDT